MTYTHLTTDELVMIEADYQQNISVTIIAERLKRSRQPIYNVVNFLKQGKSAIDYYKRYKENKKRCGRRKISLPEKEQKYMKKKVALGWTPDVIIGRAEKSISCSMRTLYRRFEDGDFDRTTLPIKAKENQTDTRNDEENKLPNATSLKEKRTILYLKVNSVTLKVTQSLVLIIKVPLSRWWSACLKPSLL